MIELTIEELVLWAVGVPLLLLGFYMLLLGLRRGRDSGKRKQQIIRCRGCGHIYQDVGRDKSSDCPECGRGNYRGDSKNLG